MLDGKVFEYSLNHEIAVGESVVPPADLEIGFGRLCRLLAPETPLNATLADSSHTIERGLRARQILIGEHHRMTGERKHERYFRSTIPAPTTPIFRISGKTRSFDLTTSFIDGRACLHR